MADSEREVMRCRVCRLNQFVAKDDRCRRCHSRMHPEPAVESKPLAMVVPAEPVMSARPRLDLAIQALRVVRGLSQRQLATRCGMVRSYLNRVERNRFAGHGPRLREVERLAEGLQVSMRFLVELACTGCERHG